MKTSQEKINKIKETLVQTREKRKSQVCKCYTLKIDYSHTNRQQKEWLKRIFIEAKWFYNHILNHDNVFDSSISKDKIAIIKVIDKYEERELDYLSSQMKQSLQKRIINAIKALSVLKSHKFSVGRLKFKPEINSIDLPQFGITWKFNKTRIKIQGLKKPFKVHGLKQIPDKCDFANAKLIRKPSGYYMQITTFQQKEKKKEIDKKVGLDFGIKDSIITSDKEKFNIKILESNRLKRNQLFFSKKKKGSKSRRIQLNKIKKEYEKITNQKKDQVNKIISYLKNNYNEIYMQDEQIANWHKGLFGRQVQQSALGAIKSKLKSLESTFVIDKWQPTTKLCPECGLLNKLSLSDRIYNCTCGYSQDRDIHSAKNILLIGQKQKSNSVMERNSTTSEDQTSGFSKSNRENLSQDSLKMEAPSFRAW